MKRKQIIEFALEFFEAGMESQIFGMPSFDQIIEADYYKRYIDAILALPLDVPSDKELDDEAFSRRYQKNNEFDAMYADAFIYGADWMKNEIIKRNK